MGGKRKRAVNESSLPSDAPHKKSKDDSRLIPSSLSADASLAKISLAEAPTPDDRKREAAVYELLGSELESERLDAATCILSSLLHQVDVPQEALLRHLDRRLFRGLASSRKASRIGFSLVITELLRHLFGAEQAAASRHPGLTFEKVLGLLVDRTQVVGNLVGQEERDHYFGQVFGIECFIRSGVLFKDLARWHAVRDMLLKLGRKKVWLRPQCGWVLVQAVEHMSKEDAEATLSKLAEEGLAKTAEGIAVWLAAYHRYPQLAVKPWRRPFSKSLDDLAAILKESFKDPTKDAKGASWDGSSHGSWTAQLHFVWDAILNAFKVGERDADENALDRFWKRVVDDGLFSKQATDGQKFKGFMVFQKMLENLVDHSSKLDYLFSRNLMSCLINQAAKEDRYLHRAAIKTLKAIESVVSSHPQALPTVLGNLLGKRGSFTFDHRTSTKTVDRLLLHVDSATVKDILAIIRRPVQHLGDQDEKDGGMILRTFANYLSKIPTFSASRGSESSSSLHRSSSWFASVLQELSALAYSMPDHVPPSLLTDPFRDLCRTRLETSLAKLARTEDTRVFCQVIESMKPTSKAMTEEIQSELDTALSRMKALLEHKSKTDDEHKLCQSLAMLHAISLFQLYNEDPDAVESLHDLAHFNQRLTSDGTADGSQGTSELLAELLLTLLARPSSLMRQVAHQVFDAFTARFSAAGLELLTRPLLSEENVEGQRDLFENGDDVDGDGTSSSIGDDDDGHSDDESSSSDVEVIGADGVREAASETSGDGDSITMADGEDGTAPATTIDVDALVGGILKSHRFDKNGEAEESSSDGDMTDSEMLALDDKLAEVFKQRSKARPDTKKQKQEAKQSVVNFKLRILDLVELYVRNEARNPQAFALLTPLLQLMRTTSAKPLSNRACQIILDYQRGLKKARAGAGAGGAGPTGTAPEADALLALLVEVHGEAGKHNAHAYAKAASAASLIVASALFAADQQAVKHIAAVYARTQSDWVLGENRLQNSFFTDWNNWCQNHASQQARA